MSDGGRYGHAVARGWRRKLLAIGTAAGVVIADQLTKTWALGQLGQGRPHHIWGPVNLVLTFNRGAAFSLGAGVAPEVEALAVALVVGVLVVSRGLARRGMSVPLAVGLGLLSGGALSNLGDRFLRHHHGAVVDFVQLVSWWPVFNVADAAITVGAVTLALGMAFSPSPSGGALAGGGPSAAAGLTPSGHDQS